MDQIIRNGDGKGTKQLDSPDALAPSNKSLDNLITDLYFPIFHPNFDSPTIVGAVLVEGFAHGFRPGEL
jgi:hypothetical protein